MSQSGAARPSKSNIPRSFLISQPVELLRTKNCKAWTALVCILLAAVSAGLSLPIQIYLMIIGGLATLGTVLVALLVQTRNPTLGFAGLILTAAAFPFEFHGPSKSILSFPFLIATYLCIGWIVALLARSHHQGLDSSRVVYAVLAFMIASIISFVAGQYPWFPVEGAPLGAQLAGLGLFLLSGGLFLAVGHQVRNLAQLRWLTWLFLGAGAVSCFADVFWLDFVSRWTKPGSLGSLFWTWLVALSFSQAAFNLQLSRATRISLYCLTGLSLYRGFFQSFDWASGWLPPLISFGVVLFFRLPRIALGLALLAAPLGLFLSTVLREAVDAHERYSLLTRLEALSVLGDVLEKSPLIGLGPANYFHYAALFPILGWYTNFSSHNNYVDLLAQVGLLGFLAFCWFIFEMVQLSLRVYSSVPGGFAQAYLIGSIGGLAGSLASGMLADWIIPFFYNIGIRGFRSSLLFWVFLGGILALKRIVSNPLDELEHSMSCEPL